MSDDAAILVFLTRGRRNTPSQLTAFARWLSAPGRRENYLRIIRSLRTSPESPFPTDKPTTPTT